MTTGVISDSLDLSLLPAPTVIEQLSYEDILAGMKADLVARMPAFDTLLETDPAIITLQVAAYREFLLRQEFNDRAKSVMLAYAGGSDLDHLAALVSVKRLVITPADPLNNVPAVMEDDAALRQRVVLAPESFSVAGPELAYVFHARSADPGVVDASCTSPTPGEVVVTVLGRDGDGTVSPQTIQAVTDSVNSRSIRPLTDHVTVQNVAPVYFSIDAQIFTYAGPDANLILNNARAKLDAYLTANRLIGRDISFSALNAALHVDGVQRVVFNSPLETLVISPIQVAHCTSVNVAFGGYDD